LIRFAARLAPRSRPFSSDRAFNLSNRRFQAEHSRNGVEVLLEQLHGFLHLPYAVVQELPSRRGIAIEQRIDWSMP
jgi:hypothetical protein